MLSLCGCVDLRDAAAENVSPLHRRRGECSMAAVGGVSALSLLPERDNAMNIWSEHSKFSSITI
jgi:hypothetical protein